MDLSAWLTDAELVTAEKPSRSIHRARAVKIVTIHPAPRQGQLPVASAASAPQLSGPAD